MILEEARIGEAAFSSPLSDLEIDVFFTLSPDEVGVICDRRGDLNRLGLALHLCIVKMTGRAELSAKLVPHVVLTRIAGQLGLSVPDLASLRSLYQDRTTLFRHRKLAIDVAGFREAGAGARSGLLQYLRQEILSTTAPDVLASKIARWLHTRQYIVFSGRDIRGLVRREIDQRNKKLAASINGKGGSQSAHWIEVLTAEIEPALSRFDWFLAGPSRKSIPALEVQSAKIAYLRQIGADNLSLDLPDAEVTRLARRVSLRKASNLERITEPQRTIELACFIQHRLEVLTDGAIDLFNHLVNDIVRRARDRAIRSVARQVSPLQALIGGIDDLVQNEALSGEELRANLVALLKPFRSERRPITRAMATRQELAVASNELSRLLKAASELKFDLPENHPLAEAFAALETAADKELPTGQANVFGRPWEGFMVDEDRAVAHRSWVAATVLLIKRSLRNGSVSIPHSRDHRDLDKHLIPRKLWEADKGRFRRNLMPQKSSEAYVARIEAALEAGVDQVVLNLKDDTLRIVDGRISLPKLVKSEVDDDVETTRRQLLALLGPIQFSDVIIEVDSLTGMSRTLLGRPPASDREQIVLYAAILALGSDLTPADIERMVAGVSADSVGQMMRKLEASGRLREANDALATFTAKLDVAKSWGGGITASADMMRLDATRTLWSARADPRRKTPAMGTYAHLSDQWTLIHDQPLVLNQRQAGAALEGALRHDGGSLEKVAVDTHGVTHFSMGLGKLLGFDICPRLARLADRKLYVFKDTKVPEPLEPIVSRTLLRRAIALGWDGLLRLAASTQGGWCSAVWAVERHSSASIGMPVYNAGEALGKLQRSVFLCDYFGRPAFRQEIQRLLSQIESMHVLQRAIHNGPISPRRGRTREQMTAISGALTLLTNVVIAWNAHRYDQAIRRSDWDRSQDHMRHIAPIAHAHINLKGTITFDLERRRNPGKNGENKTQGAVNHMR
ncbi:Tn3 family transposase [Rhodobacteraceae bacterium B1Z28]|uniref:Tn3 family transposase n=1 Tax=Ruegeria haliotis TaxID=2747601 RepID=A0ABX2PS25_9RHOB|nr:Tn3 family transposase [Ruegeria haliotis]NVO56936.1 Tn3 family transposase [Ruegeria haliotis]